MTCDYIALANPGVQKLMPYQAGKPIEELAREQGLDPAQIVKLASNENPLGIGPMAKAAIGRAMEDLARYPDGNGFDLKAALSARLDITPEQITLGNGSNEVLELLARAYVQPEHEVLFSEHAFVVYPLVTQAIGATPVQVPAKDYGHDLPAFLARINARTRMIFIANPNNPTGTWFTRAELEAFLAEVPEQVIVVLDEAYFEYVREAEYPDGISLLGQYPNLVVTRTFSKAYGLAGLRVGYGVSSAAIANVLNRVREPFNCNSLALAAATAALADAEYLAESVHVNTVGLKQMAEGCTQLGLDLIPSVGNFLTVDMGRPAGPVYEALLALGVIARPIAGYGLPNHLRISIGTEAENARCLEALAKVLGAADE